jgi:ribosome maturation factor RimP
MDNLSDTLHALIAPVLRQFNVDLIALELKGSKRNMIVRVVADQDGGISLPTCAAISRALSAELDIADLIPGRYRLEVSSPGVDWPLKTKRDFERHLGRLVNLQFQQGETVASVEGTIQAVSETDVTIAAGGEVVAVPLTSVAVGKLKLKW